MSTSRPQVINHNLYLKLKLSHLYTTKLTFMAGGFHGDGDFCTFQWHHSPAVHSVYLELIQVVSLRTQGKVEADDACLADRKWQVKTFNDIPADTAIYNANVFVCSKNLPNQTRKIPWGTILHQWNFQHQGWW